MNAVVDRAVQAAQIEAKFAKDLAVMRAWLISREYFVALDAMEFAREIHVGFRKDGITPSFAHQLYIANYAKALVGVVMYPEELLAAIFLHDTCEDYGKRVGFDDVTARFGPRVGHSVMLLTKKHRGIIIPYEVYYPRMAADAIAGLAKGMDRGHNILTMSDADWTADKQEVYLDEVDTWALPMLKAGRIKFPQQVAAYHNVKSLLTTQSVHIRIGLGLMRKLERLEATNSMQPQSILMA